MPSDLRKKSLFLPQGRGGDAVSEQARQGRKKTREKGNQPNHMAGSGGLSRWVDASYRTLLAFSLGGSLVLTSSIAVAKQNSKISLDCDNITIGECIQKLPFKVKLDSSFSSQMVQVHLAEVDSTEILGNIMGIAGIDNYAILFFGDGILVSSLDKEGGTGTDLPTSASAKLVKQDDALHPTLPLGFPAGKELEEIIEKHKNAPSVDLDTVANLPGGLKMTVRQLLASQERAMVAPNNPDQEVKLPGLESNMTLKEIDRRQQSIDSASVPTDLKVHLPGLEAPLTIQEINKRQQSADKAISQPHEIVLPNGVKLNIAGSSNGSSSPTSAKGTSVRGSTP